MSDAIHLHDHARVHEVLLVLDARFEADLWALSRSAHVWLVDSPENETRAREVWAREDGSGVFPRNGVTMFRRMGEAEATLRELLPVIDEHHGEGRAASEADDGRPWDVLFVVGAPFDAAVHDVVLAAMRGIPVTVQPAEHPSGGFAIRRVRRDV